ncbi:MAG: hypothetical protein GY811_05185 [Myxococcales bacterium]|nr:hypothetical protein [Myxococcales bacterium]
MDSVTGTSRALMDNSGGSIFPEADHVVPFSITGSVLTPEMIRAEIDTNSVLRALVAETWTRMGLEKGNPWTDTPEQSGDANGDIVITNTGDGETTSTAERQ